MTHQPLKYIIYCRKSSEAEDRQALSIDAQISELNLITEGNGLNIAAILTETKSAKEPGRPVFREMLARIENGEANAILAWKLDRLARNFDDGGRIIGLLQRGAIREIRTFEKTYLPSDNVLMIAVEFGMANQYSRDLALNVSRGIREKVRRGIYNWKAPLGYFNEPRLRTVEPHPENFKKVKRLLTLFATGRHSLTAIQEEFTTAGLLGINNRRALRLSGITSILTNPFYYGLFRYKGELHQGIHVPMITKQTFDRIQEALIANGRPRKPKADKGFLFRNFAECASCRRAVTAERHVKKSGLIFDYYRCANSRHRCGNRSFARAERFAAEVKRNMELVSIPDQWKERFLARVKTLEAQSSRIAKQQMERLRAYLVTVRSKLDRINNAFADGTIGPDEFKELKNPLLVRKVELEQRITGLHKTRVNPLEPLKSWILQGNQAQKWASEENWSEMKSFLKIVGSNRLLRAQTLTVTFKKPWNLLAETVAASRRVSDDSKRYSLWSALLDSNQGPSRYKLDALTN